MDRNDQTSVIQFSSRGTDNRYGKSGHRTIVYYLLNAMNGNALEAETRNALVAPHLYGGPNQQWR